MRAKIKSILLFFRVDRRESPFQSRAAYDLHNGDLGFAGTVLAEEIYIPELSTSTRAIPAGETP